MKNKLNKSKILISLFWIPFVMPITAIPAALLSNEFGSGNFLEIILGVTFFGLTFGIIFWLPAIIIFLLIELLLIGEKSTEKTVKIIFISEVVLALLVCGPIITKSFIGIPLIALVIGVVTTQLLRWIYLKRKNRMYQAKPLNEQIIDEIE